MHNVFDLKVFLNGSYTTKNEKNLKMKMLKKKKKPSTFCWEVFRAVRSVVK